MTVDERFARIEEKHVALAETVEVLGGMQKATEARLERVAGHLDRLIGVVEELTAMVRSHERRLNKFDGGA